MRMTDVRISVRLGACFAGLVILMGLIAAMGVRSLITATNGTREIVQQRYTKVMVVATLITMPGYCVISCWHAILRKLKPT